MRWTHKRIALKKGQASPLVLGHVLGPYLQMRLIGGGVYVQRPDGTWVHYAREADVGDKLGPAVTGLHANIHANNAHEILSMATDLRTTPGPGGTTVYSGTIRNAHVDPSMNLSQNEVTRMLAKLRGEGASDPDAPGGTYPNHSKLMMIVGHDGLVKRISFIFQQPSCRAGFPIVPHPGRRHTRVRRSPGASSTATWATTSPSSHRQLPRTPQSRRRHRPNTAARSRVHSATGAAVRDLATPMGSPGRPMLCSCCCPASVAAGAARRWWLRSSSLAS